MPASSAASMVATLSGSWLGPYVPDIAMHPSPSADTAGPFLPNCRCCIVRLPRSALGAGRMIASEVTNVNVCHLSLVPGRRAGHSARRALSRSGVDELHRSDDMVVWGQASRPSRDLWVRESRLLEKWWVRASRPHCAAETAAPTTPTRVVKG